MTPPDSEQLEEVGLESGQSSPGTAARALRRCHAWLFPGQPLPHVRIPRRASILILGFLLFAGVWLLLDGGRPANRLKDGQIDLHAGLSSSTFNSTDIELEFGEARDEPQVSEAVPAPLAIRVAPAAGPALPEPDKIGPAPPSKVISELPSKIWPILDGEATASAKAAQTQPVTLVVANERMAELCYPLRATHQGETPMSRTWQRTGLKALLAAMFTAAPGFAQATGQVKSDSEKIDTIQKQVEDIKKSIGDVKTSLKTLAVLQQEIKDVRSDNDVGTQAVIAKLNDVRNDLARFKTEVEACNKKLADLQDHNAKLLAEIETIKNRTTQTRVAGSPPTDSPPAATATARVELLNTYHTPVTVAINRVTYRLLPNERRLSNPIPAGTFTYEVFNITEQVSRTIAPNEVFKIHVHPQF